MTLIETVNVLPGMASGVEHGTLLSHFKRARASRRALEHERDAAWKTYWFFRSVNTLIAGAECYILLVLPAGRFGA